MPEPELDLNATIERVLGIAMRRRWRILLPFAGTALATVAVLSHLPNRYTSNATLVVVQQQVPERYVVPTTTTTVKEALQAMTQEVLSRGRLLGIIDELRLYPNEGKRLAPEQLMQSMRKNIDIEPIEDKSVSGFNIGFTTESPRVAQQVTSRLVSLFIAENLKTREDQATATTRFLDDQLKGVQKQLAIREAQVRDFKMRYRGELPEQQQGNFAILAGLQTQLQNTTASMNRAEQQRVYLESLLTGYTSMEPGGVVVSRGPTPLDPAEADLAKLQAERRKLLAAYTPQHPDVLRLNLQIADATALVERLKTASGTAHAEALSKPARSGATEAAIAQVKSQLESNKVEIENLARDQKQLRADIAEYQNRLNQTPVREQELAALLRDSGLLRKDYEDLLGKKMQAQLATSMEKQQAGQQFRLVDPPSLPKVPTSPKRLKISAIGAFAGLALGALLAMLADSRDHSFSSEKSVTQLFSTPLVVGIPLLLTKAEKRVRFYMRVIEWCAATVLVAVVVVAELYVYRQT